MHGALERRRRWWRRGCYFLRRHLQQLQHVAIVHVLVVDLLEHFVAIAIAAGAGVGGVRHNHLVLFNLVVVVVVVNIVVIIMVVVVLLLLMIVIGMVNQSVRLSVERRCRLRYLLCCCCCWWWWCLFYCDLLQCLVACCLGVVLVAELAVCQRRLAACSLLLRVFFSCLRCFCFCFCCCHCYYCCCCCG